VDQTKIITAASELARNTLDYGGGGTLHIELVQDGARRGVRLTFEDQDLALPTSTRPCGTASRRAKASAWGWGGQAPVQRIHDHVDPGVGTRIVIGRWK